MIGVLVVAAAWLVAPPVPPAAAATASETRMASEIAGQINAERAARGLSRLAVDSTLSSRAQGIAESNRNNGCHSCHSASLGNGEVAQWSGGPGASGRSTVAWMVSSSHRDILMSPGLTAIGVGLACYPDGGQEAVGRVTGTVTPGSPAAPVVTSRQSGTSCESTPPSTTAPPATEPVVSTPPTTGGSNSNSSDGGTKSSPSPAAPARSGVTTTTARRAAGATTRPRSTTPVDLADAVPDTAEPFDIVGDTTTTVPPTTTTVRPDGNALAAGSGTRSTRQPGGAPASSAGAAVVGLGLVGLVGATLWRTRANWLDRILLRR